MYNSISSCSLKKIPFQENNSNVDKTSLRFIENIKDVKSTSLNINHLPAEIGGKVFQCLSNEQLLVLALFSDLFFNEAKKFIERLNTVQKMDLILNLSPGKASLSIHSLAAMFERPGSEIDIKTGNTILHSAVIYRKAYLVNDLCKLKGLDINASNKDNFTAFAIAAKYGQYDMIITLLDAPDIIINVGNGKYDYTGLQYAIFNGHSEIVEKIVESGQCHINKQDKEGTTALHVAANIGSLGMTNLLLRRRDININCAHAYGDTPLMVAINKQNYGVAKTLMARNDVNIQTENALGFTALHLAMQHENGDAEIVNTLLLRESNVNKMTKQDLTPLDIATVNGFKAGVEGLLHHPQIRAGLSKGRIEDLQLSAHKSGHPEIKRLFARLSGKTIMSSQEFLRTHKY